MKSNNLSEYNLVIEQTVSGWGDNFFNIISGLVIAEKLNRIPLLSFNLPLEHVYDLQLDFISGDHYNCLRVEQLDSYESSKNIYSNASWCDIFNSTHKCIHFKTWFPLFYYILGSYNLKLKINNMFSKYFILKPEILDKIEFKPVVVHIRAGDHYLIGGKHDSTCPCIKDDEFTIMFRNMLSILEEHVSTNQKLILITDWPNVLNIFKQNLTHYNIEHYSVLKTPIHTAFINKKDIDKFISTVIEFYTIANCDYLFVCDWSNFGKIPAILNKDKNIYCWYRPDMTCKKINTIEPLLFKDYHVYTNNLIDKEDRNNTSKTDDSINSTAATYNSDMLLSILIICTFILCFIIIHVYHNFKYTYLLRYIKNVV